MFGENEDIRRWRSAGFAHFRDGLLDVAEKIQDLIIGVDLDGLDFFAIKSERFWRHDDQIGMWWRHWDHLRAAWRCGRVLDMSGLFTLGFWERWSLWTLVWWRRSEGHGGSNMFQQLLAKAQPAVLCALELHDPVVD